MNRKERRAAKQKSARAVEISADPAIAFAQARQYEAQRQFDLAAAVYRRILVLQPWHAAAANNLGCVLMQAGRGHDASAAFARALELAPQLLDDFRSICDTLATLLPAFAQAVRAAMSCWPERPPLDRMFAGTSLASIADHPLLLTILRASPVRDIEFERTLIAIRSALLDAAMTGAKVEPTMLGFCAVLGEQCFINEYVFATTPAEDERVAQLGSEIENRSGERAPVSPLQIAAFAMYRPLNSLANAPALLEMKWPAALARLLTQQIQEPQQERELRASIPALTPIADDVSARVRQQYEDNPYPRWVHLAGRTQPLSFDAYLKSVLPGELPASGFGDSVDVLVAGCGTGSHPLELTRKLRGARVLAIDLSLSSLAYAKRRTPPELAGRIEYGQADILKLGALGRSFDVIDASGVLHHMAEPEAGLRVLLALLRPGGFLHLGLYSQIARRDVQAARELLAKQGFKPMVEDIRRARALLLDSDLRSVAQSNDFYTTSECRDLLFHVQEHHLTIPQIGAMLQTNGLRFVGFVFDPPTASRYAEMFSRAGNRLTDLDAWHDFELVHPNTFRGMYQFWCQNAG